MGGGNHPLGKMCYKKKSLVRRRCCCCFPLISAKIGHQMTLTILRIILYFHFSLKGVGQMACQALTITEYLLFRGNFNFHLYEHYEKNNGSQRSKSLICWCIFAKSIKLQQHSGEHSHFLVLISFFIIAHN